MLPSAKFLCVELLDSQSTLDRASVPVFSTHDEKFVRTSLQNTERSGVLVQELLGVMWDDVQSQAAACPLGLTRCSRLVA